MLGEHRGRNMLVKLGGGVGHIKASFQEEAIPELISKGRIGMHL